MYSVCTNGVAEGGVCLPSSFVKHTASVNPILKVTADAIYGNSTTDMYI